MINLQKIKNLHSILITFFLFSLILFINKDIYSSENKIIFKLNDTVYTSLDYEQRLEYLDFVGSNQNIEKELIINDFISATIFYEYFKSSNNDQIVDKKSREIFNNIIEINKKNNKNYSFKIDENNMLFNIKIDFVRKSILEEKINSNIENFKITKEDRDLLYNYKITYINFNNYEIKKEFDNLEILNIENIKKILKKNNVSYFIKEKEIDDLNTVNERIKNNILENKKYFILENENNLSIIFIDKKFETLDGLIANIYSVRSKDKINDNNLKCDNLLKMQKNPNIIMKDYNFIELNDEIKSNLISINDYILFNNDDENIYIVLCDIKFNKEKLNNINLNKIINSNVIEIEKEFIEKYSSLYNLIKNYE